MSGPLCALGKEREAASCWVEASFHLKASKLKDPAVRGTLEFCGIVCEGFIPMEGTG